MLLFHWASVYLFSDQTNHCFCNSPPFSSCPAGGDFIRKYLELESGSGAQKKGCVLEEVYFCVSYLSNTQGIMSGRNQLLWSHRVSLTVQSVSVLGLSILLARSTVRVTVKPYHSSTANGDTFDPLILNLVFILLSWVRHFYSWLEFDGYYDAMLKREQQDVWTWYEFSVSAPVMHLLVAILCGILDGTTLAIIGILTSVTMWFGYRAEASRRLVWITLGMIPYLLQWTMITYVYADTVTGSTPLFVHFIYATTVLLDAVYPVTLTCYLYPSGRNSDGFDQVAQMEQAGTQDDADAFDKMLQYQAKKNYQSIVSKTCLDILTVSGFWSRFS
jgi:hypothetical protein